MIKSIGKLFFVISFCGLSLMACKKESDMTASNTADQQLIQDDNQAQEESEEAYLMSDEAIASAFGGRVEDPSCSKASFDKAAKSFILDFGSGCTDKAGRSRKGKIIISYQDEKPNALSARTVTFQNYTVDGKEISGSITSTPIRRNASGQFEQSRTVSGLVIKFTDGTSLKITSATNVYTVDGSGKSPINSSVFLTGNAVGINRKGEAYTRTISKPIEIKAFCAANKVGIPVSGVITYTVNTQSMSIDFGSGACDRKATLTYNGKSIEIEIP
jgi:phage baseplate assembly protein gpV